jgi:hypothetical protein
MLKSITPRISMPSEKYASLLSIETFARDKRDAHIKTKSGASMTLAAFGSIHRAMEIVLNVALAQVCHPPEA